MDRKEWNVVDLVDYVLKIVFFFIVYFVDFRIKIIKIKKYNIVNLVEWSYF